jgi:lipoprotein-anchoring transpeptidase ErfK/SrfK
VNSGAARIDQALEFFDMKMILAIAVILAGFTTTPAYAAAVEARIDLSEQRMRVYQNGRLRYNWPVSTARRGYRTPTGSWKPTRMHKMWYSRKYDNSPMPHSIFFYGGYAVHGTNQIKSLGRPASHGCIRLHPDNARALYNLVTQNGTNNTRIRITR